MAGHGTRTTRFIAVLVTAVGLVGGCTGGASPGESVPGSIASSTGPASVDAPSPAESIPARPSNAPHGTFLGEDDRGHSVVVKVGDTITVVLHSTYWSPAATSDAAVVALVSAPTVSPASPGTCLPGIGCGTVTSTFIATAPGDAQLSASRTVCGEALNCKDADRSWTVDVHVTS